MDVNKRAFRPRKVVVSWLFIYTFAFRLMKGTCNRVGIFHLCPKFHTCDEVWNQINTENSHPCTWSGKDGISHACFRFLIIDHVKSGVNTENSCLHMVSVGTIWLSCVVCKSVLLFFNTNGVFCSYCRLYRCIFIQNCCQCPRKS